MTDPNQFDKESVFFHSKTEYDMIKSGRAAYGEGESRYPAKFKADDPDYPGLKIGVDDGLEPGKPYRRTYPAPVPDEDLRIVHGGEYGDDGVAVIQDSLKKGLIFDASRNLSEQELKDEYREWHYRSATTYEPWKPE